MSYEINLERYGAPQAWFAAKARDAMDGFGCEAAATLQDRRARGEGFLELLVGSMADEAFELRALGRGGPPGQPEKLSCSYLFVDEGRATVVVEPSYHGVSVRVGAHDRAEAEALLNHLDRLVPKRKRPPEDVIPFRFWRLTRGCGAKFSDRDLRCPDLSGLTDNYAADVAAELQRLADHARPDADGKVVLWHGPPGTGKTYAVRALARAWKQRLRASVEVVLDPDELFARADYLHDVLLNDDLSEWVEDDDDERLGDVRGKLRRPLRLVIIEDSASLFGDHCRSSAGFARLLNLSDGIIGQGLRVVFLLTTNEQLTSIDPAITRPGRCLGVTCFDPLPVDQAQAWLAARDAGRTATPLTLSELYARCGRARTG